MKTLNNIHLIVILIGMSVISYYTFNAFKINSFQKALERNLYKFDKTKSTCPELHLKERFLTFNAIKNKDRVMLFWTLKSDSNNHFFTVEKSSNNVDFEPVCIIDATNTNNGITQYIETDYKPLDGISYYRLKLTPYNNEISYSRTEPVNFIYNKNNNQISPNTLSVFELKSNLRKFESSRILVLLRDDEGKEYYSKVHVITEDSEIICIEREHILRAGSYLVTACSNNLLYSQKLIVR